MANSVEDYLIDGLSFKLKPGASYVNERKSVTFHPQGGNHYTTNGVRVIKLLITGDQWLDPSTFAVIFNLYNTATDTNKRLRPVSGPHAFFKRMRLLCNGQIVEDIDDYNRVHEMFRMLQPLEKRKNEEVQGFGNVWDVEDHHGNVAIPGLYESSIDDGQYQTVLFKPLAGLLMQPKYIPLRYCPLTLELELVNDVQEPLFNKLKTSVEGPYSDSPYTPGETSLEWRIEEVMVKCDVCTLDNALDNSYAEHLLSGKSLPINYNTFVSQIQSTLSGTAGQKTVRLNITRAISRLKSVFVTLYRPTIEAFQNVKTAGRNKFNTFYSPAFNSDRPGAPDASDEFEFQIQVGSKLFPEYPIRSHSEAYYQLRKTTGTNDDKFFTNGIGWKSYRSAKFILAIDTEKVLEAGFTGINTRAGDILNLRFDHNSGDPRAYAHEMQVVLHSDNIMEIRDSGITIFD